MENDPELTWREIQVAVWMLAPFQDFDMNMPVNELPEEVRSNGQPNFDKDKVQFIVDAVLNRSTAKTVEGFDGSADFWSFKKKKTMCVIGTDKDTQTLITPCDETAFAYGGNYDASYSRVTGFPWGSDGYANCFPESPFRAPFRWGWTNGKLGEGDYTFPLYAGAGLCKLSRGQYAGDVEIEYDDGKATVTFTASDGASFLETHLHVSNHALPRLRNGRITLAPGQYASNDDVVSVSDNEIVYEVHNLSGDIYIIAQAKMSGYYDD